MSVSDLEGKRFQPSNFSDHPSGGQWNQYRRDWKDNLAAVKSEIGRSGDVGIVLDCSKENAFLPLQTVNLAHMLHS